MRGDGGVRRRQKECLAGPCMSEQLVRRVDHLTDRCVIAGPTLSDVPDEGLTRSDRGGDQGRPAPLVLHGRDHVRSRLDGSQGMLAVVVRGTEEGDDLIGHELVDGPVARDHSARRDLVEVVQPLDHLRRRESLRGLSGARQPHDGHRDRDLPTRRREFISGRA